MRILWERDSRPIRLKRREFLEVLIGLAMLFLIPVRLFRYGGKHRLNGYRRLKCLTMFDLYGPGKYGG